MEFVLQWGGELTAEQRGGGAAEQDARRGSGAVVAAAGWGLGFQGVRPGAFKGGAGFLGMRAP